MAISIFFLWRAVVLLKFEGTFEILKTTSGSSPRTDLSNKTTFSHSQSHATVPFRKVLSEFPIFFYFSRKSVTHLLRWQTVASAWAAQPACFHTNLLLEWDTLPAFATIWIDMRMMMQGIWITAIHEDYYQNIWTRAKSWWTTATTRWARTRTWRTRKTT